MERGIEEPTGTGAEHRMLGERLSMKAKQGVALVLIAGILMLMAGIAVAMLALASGLRVQAATATDRTAAGLLARSGIEYGSARLSRNPSPSNSSTPANQPDDCTFRDGPGIPLEISLNPSYAQTEPYADLQGNGKYDPGAEPYQDLDGNGRFDAWSGRLRGKHGMTGQTFKLKIAPEGGKVSVNGGLTCAPFYNQLGKNCWKPPVLVYMKSFDLPENGCIAELIDTVWEVLRSLGPEYYAYYSSLGIVGIPRQEPGERIILGRPLGGYRSLEEIPDRAKIPPDQWEALKGYLTIQGGGLRQAFLQGHYAFGYNHHGLGSTSEDDPGYMIVRGCYQPYGDAGPDASLAGLHPMARRRPICLGSADPIVLQALFQNLVSPCFTALRSWSIPSALAVVNPLGGGVSIPSADASLLAGFLLKSRPFASWHDLWLGLNRDGGAIFVSAPVQATSGFGSYAMSPLHARNMMADLVFANANPDNMEARIPIQRANSFHDTYQDGFYYPVGRRSIPPLSWVSYDLDRQADPVGPSRAERLVDKSQVLKLVQSSPAGGSARDNASGFSTLELSLDPETEFTIESLGGIRTAHRLTASSLLSAGVQPDRSLSAHVQDEFENGGTARAWNLPAGASLEGQCSKRMTQTYPMFPLDSCPDLRDGANGEIQARYALGSPVCGDIRLMHYASGEARGAAFYAPMWEEGQPLRTPKHAAGWLENFRDIAGRADPEMIWASGNDSLPQRDFLESGVTWKMYFDMDPIPPPPDDWYWFRENFEGAIYAHHPVIPGSIFPRGRYTWNHEAVPQARNAGDFPMVGADGAVSEGTLELWSAEQASKQANPLKAALTVSDTIHWDQAGNVTIPVIGWREEVPAALEAELMTAPGFFSQPDWHHVAVAIAGGSVDLSVDGILRVSGHYENYSLNPLTLQAWEHASSDAGFQSEIRFYQRHLDANEVLAHASQGRFWSPASVGGNGEIPSYTSPLYRFDSPVELTHARWDGFVPKLVADAWGAGDTVPMSVELLCYDTSAPAAGETPRWTVPFPIEFWRSGGGGVDFKKMWAAAVHSAERIPRISALRYRVWMDVSVVSGFNNETPVFDSIQIRCRSNGNKISSWAER